MIMVSLLLLGLGITFMEVLVLIGGLIGLLYHLGINMKYILLFIAAMFLSFTGCKDGEQEKMSIRCMELWSIASDVEWDKEYLDSTAKTYIVRCCELIDGTDNQRLSEEEGNCMAELIADTPTEDVKTKSDVEKEDK